MILAVFVGFWDTVLSDQHGFGRLFANVGRLLLRPRGRWADEAFLRRIVVVVLVTVLPIGLYLATGEPVALLQLAEAIAAAHIPVVAGLTLYLNHRALPADLRPSPPVFAATVLAALFLAAFAAVYLAQLAGVAG